MQFFVLAAVVAVVSSDRVLSSVDEYITNNQRDCIVSRKILSCVKYKIGKFLWTTAMTNGNAENSTIPEEGVAFSFVKLKQPTPGVLYPRARYHPDDGEVTKGWKFLKRTGEAFLKNHGIQLSLPTNSGAKVYEGCTPEFESRGDKKKKKWLIILPLIILMKVMHLKMTLVPLVLGIGFIQLILVIGGSYLIYYLKNNTLCKIQPHLIKTHSHIYDHDPDYSTFTGPSSYIGHHSSLGYTKDWASDKAYNAYSNYLDTVDKIREYT